MSDENEELGEIQTEPPTDSDWCQWAGGDLCFAHGAQWTAELLDAAMFRTHDKTGRVEALVSPDDGRTWHWRDVESINAPAKLKAIK